MYNCMVAKARSLRKSCRKSFGTMYNFIATKVNKNISYGGECFDKIRTKKEYSYMMGCKIAE